MGISVMHPQKIIKWLDKELLARGINEYRFCLENENYICDKFGNFYSICVENIRNGKKYKQYRILPIHGSIEVSYVVFRITVNGIRKHLRAHRLMANSWLGEHKGLVVNHIDGNKLNNSLDNLEWCTIAENNKHAIRCGLYDPRAMNKRVYSLPKEEWMTVYILHKHCNYSYRRLGVMNRCSRGEIESICNRIDEMLGGVFDNGKQTIRLSVN